MNKTLTKLKNEFAMEVTDLNGAQTQLRPQGRLEAWTIQQIMEHLMLTYQSTAAIMDKRLEKGTPTRATPKMSQRVSQFVIARLGYFPKGYSAPEMVRPGPSQTMMDGRQLSASFAAALAAMDARLSDVEKLIGGGRCVSHIALGPMSMEQWRRFHLTHGRHHLKQIMQIRKAQSAAGVEAPVYGQA